MHVSQPLGSRTYTEPSCSLIKLGGTAHPPERRELAALLALPRRRRATMSQHRHVLHVYIAVCMRACSHAAVGASTSLLVVGAGLAKHGGEGVLLALVEARGDSLVQPVWVCHPWHRVWHILHMPSRKLQIVGFSLHCDAATAPHLFECVTVIVGGRVCSMGSRIPQTAARTAQFVHTWYAAGIVMIFWMADPRRSL